MKLNENLKSLMVRERMSLAELSRLSKVPKQTLHNWICGAEPKSLDQIKSVADVFSLSIEEMCYGQKPLSKNIDLKAIEAEINAGVFEIVIRKVLK